jgi:ABC-type uncharacterized transport system permease subunit
MVWLIIAAALGMVVYRIAFAIALNTTLRLPASEPIKLEATDIKLASAAVVGGMLAIPRIRAARDERRRRRAR